MQIKLNAAARLLAAAPNKLKNEVMRVLTSKDFTVDRQGDSIFMVHAPKEKTIEALEGAGWEYSKNYEEFQKQGEEYSLALLSSGSVSKLEFIYEG